MKPLLKTAIAEWARAYFDIDNCRIEPLAVEASFRQFWRCVDCSGSRVLMSSPPMTENNSQFIELSKLYNSANIPVPTVFEHDLERGFLLVHDMGATSYSSCYRKGFIQEPLSIAVGMIHRIQELKDSAIPLYTLDRLHDEIEIFRTFICKELLSISDRVMVDTESNLLASIDAIPRGTVHRDFHCRNLVWSDKPPHIGIVDFQDSLRGPVTYDLASLLYDCYWNHTSTTIEWAINKFWTDLQKDKKSYFGSQTALSSAVSLTAIQRLLKAAGIFARLWLTRQQDTHIRYIVPTLRRVLQLGREFEITQDLNGWLETVVVPKLLLRPEIDN